MLSLLIPETKEFMNHMLIAETFDNFSLVEASVSTYMTTVFDGHLNKNFYSAGELEELNLSDCEYVPWGKAKPFLFQLIKGTHIPLSFKITLSLNSKNIQNVLSRLKTDIQPAQVKGLLVNFKFQNNKITCTTATSLTVFSLDKSLDLEWDSLFIKFLKSKSIVSTQL